MFNQYTRTMKKLSKYEQRVKEATSQAYKVIDDFNVTSIKQSYYEYGEKEAKYRLFTVIEYHFPNMAYDVDYNTMFSDIINRP